MYLIFIQHAAAHNPCYSRADFTTKVNLMDTQIGAGNITAAQATWNEVHAMMLSVLAVSKQSIHNATSPADEDQPYEYSYRPKAFIIDIWSPENRPCNKPRSN